MDTKDARKLPLAVLNERRRRAVKLRERGMTLREVPAECELSVPTVMAAHRAFVQGGWPAVKVKPRGRKKGQGRQLSAEQERELRGLICDKTPDQLKLGFALWIARRWRS
jgi:sulfate adenylyltransferase subunit 2